MLSNATHSLNLLVPSTPIQGLNDAHGKASGEDGQSPASGFLSLLQNLHSGNAEASEEQDIAALVQWIEQKSGEKFPLEELNALVGDEGVIDLQSLENLGEFVHQPGVDAMSDGLVLPEQLTGDDLLSFLMANAESADPITDLQDVSARLNRIIETLEQALENDFESSPLSDEDENRLEQIIPVLEDVQAWLKTLSKGNAGLVQTEEHLLPPESDVSSLPGRPVARVETPLAASVSQINQTVLATKSPSDRQTPDLALKSEFLKSSGDSRIEPSMGTKAGSENLSDSLRLSQRSELSLSGEQKQAGPVETPPTGSPVSALVGSWTEKNTKGATVTESGGADRLRTASLHDSNGRLESLFAELSPDERSALEQGALAPRIGLSRGQENVAMPQTLAEQLAKPMKLQEAAQALSERIQTMVSGGLQRAVIRLDPPELGALELRVHVQNDQTQVQIVSPSPQVREALEQNSARLRETLAQHGLDLTQVDVSDHQSGSSGGSDGNGSDSRSGDGFADDVEPVDDSAAQLKQIGLVDQYV